METLFHLHQLELSNFASVQAQGMAYPGQLTLKAQGYIPGMSYLGRGQAAKLSFERLVIYLLPPRSNASKRNRPHSPISIANLLWYLK